jgi:rubrerythrin
MKDMQLLQDLLFFEKESIETMQEEISITSDEKALEVLEEIFQDHISQYNEIVGMMKKLNPQSQEKELPITQEVEPSEEEITTEEDMEEELEDLLEETVMQISEYEGFAKETENEEIRTMITGFAQEEKEHEEKLKKLLDSI